MPFNFGNFLGALDPRKRNPYEPVFGNDLPSQGGIMGGPLVNRISQSVSDDVLPNPYGSQPTQPSLSDMWDKIVNNRPNYNRLGDLINQGPPEVPTSKKTRLGAMLSASLIGFNDPMAGYAVGRNLVNEGQNKADEDYQQQVKNLAGLAGLEDKSIQDRIDALRYQNEDRYKQRDESRLDRLAANTERGTQSEIDYRNQMLDEKNWVDVTDPHTGITVQKNVKTQATRPIGQTKLTPEEELANKRKEEQQQSDIIGARERSVENLRQEGENNRLDKTLKSRSDLQAAKDKASNERNAARITAKASGLKPSDANRQVYLDLASAITSDPQLSGITPDDYINEDPTTHQLTVKGESTFGDSDEDKVIKSKLKGILSSAYSKAAGGGRGGTIAPKLPAGFTVK